jgi:hypothetical protein
MFKREMTVIAPQATEEPIEVLSITWGERKIRPSHGRHVTGRFPLGGGLGSVPFESGIERDAYGWAASFPWLQAVSAQPVTIKGYIGQRFTVYTPDSIWQYRRPPPKLAAEGFGTRTIIEVKPPGLCRDPTANAKLCMASVALKLPARFITYLENPHV